MQTQVLIIGGGATGTSLARDLALRGVSSVLAERSDVNAGASGRNHGLLHSGARYVAGDRSAAVECREEGDILKRVAPQCIQETQGLFVAVEGDDERYAADFPGYCERAGIAARRLDVAEAREMEPILSERLIAAYEVPDASVDPFRLSLESLVEAEAHGCTTLRHTQVVGFERVGRRIRAAVLRDRETGQDEVVEVEQVVNAAGAWAGEVAALAGARVELLYSKGTLIITHGRLARRVVNRLRPPGDADIMMPGGTVSIVGTTSIPVPSLDGIRPTVEEVDHIVEQASPMLPALERVRCIRAYAGVRPLVTSGGGAADGRAVSRGFALFDHQAEGLENFVTITGGKLTTCRLMAEKAADLVCGRLGNDEPCRTRTTRLAEAAECAWTEPGVGPRRWMTAHAAGDPLVCECEMVSASAIDAIVRALRAKGEAPTLTDIGLRSRVGKGACQGAFCAVRAVGHLYAGGAFEGRGGLGQLIDFFGERWRGVLPVLWGEQLAQTELVEAVHCALFSEELLSPRTARTAGEEPPPA